MKKYFLVLSLLMLLNSCATTSQSGWSDRGDSGNPSSLDAVRMLQPPKTRY